MAILAVAVLIGAALLRFAQVPEPGSTSFLAVGLLSVATLLFLVGSIFQWWMVIVIPVVSTVTFLAAHWVTSSYVDPANDGSVPELQPEEHDAAEGGEQPRSCTGPSLPCGGLDKLDQRQSSQREAATTSSAIWMVLSAAPLRRLSPDTKSARPRLSGTPGS